MKKLSLLAAASLLALNALAADTMSFSVVVDNLDVHKNTKLHVREYWKSIVNQSVSWSGEVYDVKASRNKVQLLVADKSRPLYKGYNIVVMTRDVAAAADLKIGQRVRFTGTLHGYKAEREGAVLELAESQLAAGASVVSRDMEPKAAPVRSRSRAISQSPPASEADAPPPAPVASQSHRSARPAQTPAPSQSPSQLPTQGFGDSPAPAPSGSGTGLPTGE